MDQAQVHYQMCIHFDPGYAEAHNNLGAHYKDLGQNDKAIWHYKEAARSKPTFCLPLSNLASLYHGMGRVELAQEAGETAIKIDPNFAEAHNNLGSVYLDQGLSEKAVASFQKCLDLDPHNERLKADNKPAKKQRKRLCLEAFRGHSPGVIKQLNELVAVPLLHPGLFRAVGIAPPHGLIVSGSSGSGKSILVRKVAILFLLLFLFLFFFQNSANSRDHLMYYYI